VPAEDALARLLDRRATPDTAHADPLLRALVNASPLAMWALDPHGCIILWNRGAERLTGFTADEALGKPSPIVPSEKLDEFRTLFAQALRKEPVVDVEVRRQRKDGSPIDLSLSCAALVAADGAVVAVLVMAADLTARKEAEEASRRLAAERAAREAADASRKQLVGIVESISDAYSAYDREWRYTYINRRYAALVRESGRDPDSLIGRVVWEVFPEVVGTKFHTEALRAAREGQPVEFDEHYARLDQTFNVRVFPTPDGFVSITRDVSERRRAERALEESEARFRAMAEELRSERTRAEAEHAQLLGAERAARERTDRLQAVTAALVETLTVEDVADRVVETVAATTHARSVSLALLTGDGSHFEIVKIVGVPEDFAAKWRRYAADPGYISTQVVRTGAPMFLGNPDEIKAHFPNLADTLRESGFAACAVLPLVIRGTTVGTLGLNYATPQPFDAGKRAYLAAVTQQCAQALERARLFEAERSARGEAESARREADAARTAAEEASRAKSDFLATMSHELRTPLNAIIGYQNLLADGVTGPVSDTQRRQLDRIGTSAHHLLMLIDEVLTLSRVEAGKERVHVEPVDVARILDEAKSIIEPLATQKGLEFKVIEPPSPIVIQSDAGKLRQALLNMLSNAVKFTGRGSVILHVLDAGDAVAFEVRDTGIGIAAEHFERIFEPFWQVEASMTRTTTGTGLGLAVTRRLARLLGGDVTVQSAVGEGSTFTLRLPRNRGES
jgi:PAS domain S-box-containing protein